MRRERWKQFSIWTAACALAVVAAAWWLGLRINRTASFPVGIYRVSEGRWKCGDLVLVDVPMDWEVFKVARERGYLFGSYRPGAVIPLLKRVVAVEGDRVDVRAMGAVNSRELANSAVRTADSAGRPLAPAQGGIVPPGQVWVMSEANPLSFDSRYFGPLPATLIRGRATPLWTW
jgi:conjugative transfer signal peptidase TraF